MTKVALIIIYNHRFDQNIEALERIYQDRFTHIFHLMPFYTGNKPNVIPVYENSYYFQGYVAQAFRSFYREDFTHYFFVADDLILNPVVNERTFTTEMPLPDGYSFLSQFQFYNDRGTGFWNRVELAHDWQIHQSGLQISQELPPAEEVRKRFTRFGLPFAPLRFDQIWKTPRTFQEWGQALLRRPVFCLRSLTNRILKKTYPLSYPLIGGYADIFVVTGDAIRNFCHYCGVFAAGSLFVEHAIPTALVLATDRIITGRNMKLEGTALWTQEQLEELEKYRKSLHNLLSDFPPTCLYLHPVKLSQWLVDLDVTSVHKLENELLLEHTGYTHQIENRYLEEGDLCFTSTGCDPYLFLPRVALDPNRTTWITLEITVPQKTTIQLFYQPVALPQFTEEFSCRKFVPAGRHTVVWTVAGGMNGECRLDPGISAGDYRIHSITFCQ